MNTSEQTPVDETTVQAIAIDQAAEPPIPWSQELRRRNRHLRRLLESEESSPAADEPWRLKLIQRALFSTWLDQRSAKRSRRTSRKPT